MQELQEVSRQIETKEVVEFSRQTSPASPRAERTTTTQPVRFLRGDVTFATSAPLRAWPAPVLPLRR